MSTYVDKIEKSEKSERMDVDENVKVESEIATDEAKASAASVEMPQQTDKANERHVDNIYGKLASSLTRLPHQDHSYSISDAKLGRLNVSNSEETKKYGD